MTEGSRLRWNPSGSGTLDAIGGASIIANVGDIRIASNYDAGSSAGRLEGAITNLDGDDGVDSIDADYTIPSTAHVIFARGASCAVATGITLTINGTIEAGLYQIFNLAGTGAVVFGSGCVEEVYPQWFGAKADGATDDSAAIAAAINAAGTNGRIYFARSSNYYKAQNITPLAGQTLCGAWLGSHISYSGGNNPVFLLTNGNITLESLQISHPSPAGSDGVCVKWSGAINSLRLHHCWLADAWFGLKTVGGGEISIIDSVIETCSSAGMFLQGSYEVRIVGSWIGLNKIGIVTGLNGATRCRWITIVGSHLDANNEDAIQLSSADAVTITSNSFYKNGQTADNTYNSIAIYDCTGISIVGNTGTVDATKDVAYHVYVYANTPASEVQMAANTWPIPKTAEVYYAANLVDAGAQAFNTPRIIYNDAIPSAGTWKQNDICWNIAPAAGGDPGWVCVTGGTPGTWKAMANLDA